MKDRIHALLEHTGFQYFIIGAILVNAAALGFMTNDALSPTVHVALERLDQACLVIFCIEITLKFMVHRGRFFRDGWNVFDVIVVAIALAPATGPLSVLRAMRVFRLMRLVTIIPSMRRVVSGMFSALPGVGSVAGVLLVMFYVAAIMGTTFFGDVAPEHFGSLGTTFFTLFQFLTLEGWPDVARPVMEQMPYAWLFFIPFIVLTTFTTLNLLFGIIVNAMDDAKQEQAREALAMQGIASPAETNAMRLAVIESDVKALRAQVAALKASLPPAP